MRAWPCIAVAASLAIACGEASGPSPDVTGTYACIEITLNGRPEQCTAVDTLVLGADLTYNWGVDSLSGTPRTGPYRVRGSTVTLDPGTSRALPGSFDRGILTFSGISIQGPFTLRMRLL